MMKPKFTQDFSSSIVNLGVLALLLLPEMIMSFLLWATNFPHKINLYYACMVLFPLLFIFATDSSSAYSTMLRSQYQRFSWRTIAAAIGTLVFGFLIQNTVLLLIVHHAEWNIWRTPAWKDPGNIVFLLVNPAMETFFWRVFMHRELAVRWFPDKSRSDDQLLPLIKGTTALPRLSTFGVFLNGAAYSLYHYVPMVIYDVPTYSKAGVTYNMAYMLMAWLVVFGVLAIHVRERLGIIAAWTFHVGVDLTCVLGYTYLMLKATGRGSSQLYASWEF